MSPRNEAYNIPNNQVRIFQRNAKKLTNGPYYCPSCGKDQLQILVDSKKKEAYAFCPNCKLEKQLTYAPVFQGVDYHSKFIDQYKKNNCSGQ